MDETADLISFRRNVQTMIENHPIVRCNSYTAWFSKGDISDEQLRHFTVQFSVFSHLFIEAQLRKCINSLDLSTYRAGKQILLNELGVGFTRNGSIDGGRFRFTAAHFEWLAEFAESLGLRFDQIGKRSHGTQSTLTFCDELLKWYGSDNPSVAAGASHAIEHWAAAGFWKELISGLRSVKRNRIPNLPLAFWIHHDRLEDQHAMHTDDELDEAFARPDFSPDAFLQGAQAMLDAVQIFWSGLESDRDQCLIA
jgi:hypothetical protein